MVCVDISMSGQGNVKKIFSKSPNWVYNESMGGKISWVIFWIYLSILAIVAAGLAVCGSGVAGGRA